jgi:hypothetical protein
VKIAKRFRPEMVVSKGKGADPILTDPYLDAKEDRLVAMNRHALVALPVETEKGERSRYLACSLLEAGRKLGEADVPAEIHDQEIVTYGVLWPAAQERSFPPWTTLVPKLHAGDPGTTTIHLNPKLLRAIAGAMDCEGGVALTFQLGSREAPILVQPIHPDPEEFGLLMPLSQGGEDDVDPDQRCPVCKKLLAAGASCPNCPPEAVLDALAALGRTTDGTRVSVSVNGGEEVDVTAFAEKRAARKTGEPAALKWERDADELVAHVEGLGTFDIEARDPGRHVVYFTTVAASKALQVGETSTENEAKDLARRHQLALGANALLKNGGGGALVKPELAGEAVARKKGGRR